MTTMKYADHGTHGTESFRDAGGWSARSWHRPSYAYGYAFDRRSRREAERAATRKMRLAVSASFADIESAA